MPSHSEEAAQEISYSSRKASVGYLEPEETERQLSNADESNRGDYSERRDSFNPQGELEEPAQLEPLPSFAAFLGVIENEEYRYIGEVRNEVRDGFGVCHNKMATLSRALLKTIGKKAVEY